MHTCAKFGPDRSRWCTNQNELDYCCQLWSPSKKGDVQALEQLQSYNIRKISGIQHLTHWQRLKYLSLNSFERRRERYLIMYEKTTFVWRRLEQHARHFDLPWSCGIHCHWHVSRGRYCQVPRVSHQAPSTVQTIRYGSFAVRGRPTVHLNRSSMHWTHFSKLYPMSLRHLDTPT